MYFKKHDLLLTDFFLTFGKLLGPIQGTETPEVNNYFLFMSMTLGY